MTIFSDMTKGRIFPAGQPHGERKMVFIADWSGAYVLAFNMLEFSLQTVPGRKHAQA
jgi:hypothetical protein